MTAMNADPVAISGAASDETQLLAGAARSGMELGMAPAEVTEELI